MYDILESVNLLLLQRCFYYSLFNASSFYVFICLFMYGEYCVLTNECDQLNFVCLELCYVLGRQL